MKTGTNITFNDETERFSPKTGKKTITFTLTTAMQYLLGYSVKEIKQLKENTCR